MALLLNYPLDGSINNTITDINSNDFVIISSIIPNQFQSSVAQGTYCNANQIKLIFGIPVVNNYTSIYNTSPWQIEFELCCLSTPSSLDKGIFSIERPDENGDVSFAIYFNGYNDDSMTKKNIQLDPSFVVEWHKYVIFVEQNTIKVKIDGIEIEKYSRSFYFDKPNMTLILGSLSNSISCGIKNLKVCYGEVSAPSKVDYMHETTASIVVRKSASTIPLQVEIPFPYKQFTEMEFIVSDKYRNFIPDKYYQRIDDTHIYFPLSSVNTLNLNDEDELRFTFCHNKGFYAINKVEYHAVTKSTQREYKFNTPFGEIMDLDTRFKVFYDRKLLYPDSDIHYKFNLYEGIFIFDEDFEIENNKDLDIVVFYTGNKFNRSVTTLPMSGYITLKKHEIDRNYNKNLMGIFVNGKLVNRNDIIDMSNNIHKISRDIESRYNVEVKSFSPKIASLIPFYKKQSHMLDIPKQYCYHEFPCMFTIPYPNDPYNRQKLENTGLNPILLDDINPDHYISLIHHGYQDTKDIDTVVRYDLYFYRDDYIKNPEDVSVLAQIRTSGNEGQFKWIPDSNTAVLVGKIPAHMTSTLVDYSLMSIKIKTIISQDSSQNNNTIDGIVCRFGILKNTKDKYYPVYYELDTNVYEHGDTVGIFEWIISTEPEGKGEVIYRRTVFLHPDNDPYDREVNE